MVFILLGIFLQASRDLSGTMTIDSLSEFQPLCSPTEWGRGYLDDLFLNAGLEVFLG